MTFVPSESIGAGAGRRCAGSTCGSGGGCPGDPRHHHHRRPRGPHIWASPPPHTSHPAPPSPDPPQVKYYIQSNATTEGTAIGAANNALEAVGGASNASEAVGGAKEVRPAGIPLS